MLLVPRQLMRSGMTGATPYYGGRFTPAQAYAASHPSAPPPPRPVTNKSPVRVKSHGRNSGGSNQRHSSSNDSQSSTIWSMR